ncbi:serine/threonine-protein kinase [Nocardioides taihuensis]|uniref:non-specific serine/threonine protein kinase n=1 Tax=Nocardioides taihuensis TaxID=1835606 RepID=A0ABW0BIK7_9ACTN
MPSSRPDSPEVPASTSPHDRYDLGPLLGRGGMADVHRGHDRLLQRDVAVKVLRDDLPPGSSGRERFVSEARLLAGLSHANLVTVLDAGFSGDQPYLVMELVEGRNLAQVLTEGTLDPADAAAVGAQVAEALAHAHGQGVVHRDVKPANVLVDDHRRVRLADFGIARLVDDVAGHTRTGTVIGTVAYLAPEQVAGEPVTAAADVYSLGLVVLESLTGVRAFPGSTAESGLARLQRPPEVPGSVPHRLRELLTRMTSREPVGRPTALEVAQELRHPDVASVGHADRDADRDADPGAGATRLLTGVVPTAAPPSPRPGPASHVDRARARVLALPHHTRVVVAAVAALAVLILLVAVLGSADGGSGSPAELPSDTPRNLRQPLQDLHDAVESP